MHAIHLLWSLLLVCLWQFLVNLILKLLIILLWPPLFLIIVLWSLSGIFSSLFGVELPLLIMHVPSLLELLELLQLSFLHCLSLLVREVDDHLLLQRSFLLSEFFLSLAQIFFILRVLIKIFILIANGVLSFFEHCIVFDRIRAVAVLALREPIVVHGPRLALPLLRLRCFSITSLVWCWLAKMREHIIDCTLSKRKLLLLTSRLF